MATRGTKEILSKTKLLDEAVGVVVANNVHEIITIDDFAHLNEKSVKGLLRVIRRPEGTNGGCPILGLQCQIWLIRNYKALFIIASTSKGLGARARTHMLNSLRYTQCNTSGKWRRHTRILQWYLPLIQGTVPRHWKRWNST